MEEKINNKRIFSYVPSLIARIILESELKDEDVFFNNRKNNRRNTLLISSSKQNRKYSRVFDMHSSVQTNPEIFPLEYPLSHSIIMSVKLKGFQELILTLGVNDPKKQKVKLNCEYLPILTSKILLQITSIITENGGEIVKLDDFEFYAIWDFSDIDIRFLSQYQHFYAKHAVISAYDIIKKVDNTEIIKGFKLKVSIGLAYGETSLFFFGGERRRSDFVLMGETIEESEHCLNQCGPHEIIIGREINNIFKGKGEIVTDQVGTDDKNKNIYKINIDNTDEYELKNFQEYKEFKLSSNYIAMNQKVYQNLSKKVYMLSSVLPQGLVKYLDIGEDANLKEISIITIMTVHIIIDLDLIDNSRQIQNLVKDLQKATYLTRGSLIGVIKTFNGLMVRSVWGLEPNTFVDETARAISTAFAMKKLTNFYKIKISIGIATGCCFTGLINIQGNRKMYSILGFKAIISRLLADKGNRKNIKNSMINLNSSDNNFIVYCDKDTMKFSQKWVRHNFVNDLFMFNESNNDDSSDTSIKKEINEIKKRNLSQNKENNSSKKVPKLKRFKTINNKRKNSNKNFNKDKLEDNKNENKNENNYEHIKSKNVIKIDEIYTPIEYDEYFFQTNSDPFPLIRTYKYNSHDTKKNTYSTYNYLNSYLEKEEKIIDFSNKNLVEVNNNNNINININNNIKAITNNELKQSLPKTRNASKTVYIKRKTMKKGSRKGISEEKQKNDPNKVANKFIRIDSRFDSIQIKAIKQTRKEEKNIYSIINRLAFNNQHKSKDYKSLLKLKKSQNIIGVHDKVSLLVKFLNREYSQNKNQFFLIKGPLGIGKSLFVRKVLNNFIALNNDLGKNYFNTEYQFLFCNLVNPFTSLLPYNTLSLIFRKIFLLLKLEKKMNSVLALFYKLLLDNNSIQNINFILSLGRGDVNLLNEFNFFKTNKKNKLSIKKVEFKDISINNKNNNKKNNEVQPSFKSIITEYEGPYNYDNIDKINAFFYEMIKLYVEHLKSKTKKEFILPLIFVLDDIQLSDKYSISFIEFLYNKTVINKENNDLNPFMCIMLQQTPFNQKYRGLNPPDLDKFLNKYIVPESSNYFENKIICFDIKPIYDKNILKKIIIFHFKNSVFKQYGTELNVVDNKILDFLLSKSFNGIPYLVINLLKSLIDSDKFIQILSGELIITSELNDESDIMDWNDILIPYIYEKITSNSINKILNFREILILKYASIIGTIFDIKTLDKINPLNSIIKIENIINLTEKLNKEYIAELYNDDQMKKNKLICQITFPFLREALYQKFLMEARAPLHMKLAGVISMSKRIIYFSLDDEIKSLKKHLFNSEINIINELKIYKTEIKTTKDILQSKKDLSFNNLRILLIKEICHNFYRFQLDNLLDGNLELYSSSKSSWIRVYYIINTKKILIYNQEDEKKKKEERHPILVLGLNSIYRNELSMEYSNKTKSNILELCVSEEGPAWARGFYSPRRKKQYYFASEKIKDVYQLEIGINFLKMKVNYDDFTNYYGATRFPLFKMKWFLKKEEKYLFDSGNFFNLWNIREKNKKEKKKSGFISVENLIDKSKGITKPFTVIMKSTLGLFLGLIQENIANFNNRMNKNNNDNSYPYIQIPNHIKKPLNKLFYLESFVNKNPNSNNPSSSGKKTDLNKSNFSIKNIDDIMESNIKSMKKNNNNISMNDSFISQKSTFKNKKNEKKSNKNKTKLSKEITLKLDISMENNDKTQKNNEFLKLYPNTVKNKENLLNNISLNDEKNKKYEKYFYIPKISFPKNPSSQVKKKDLEEEEPLFTESNFNTSNNISLLNGNDSTKLTCSTNKNINDSLKGKNKQKLDESFLGSFLGLNNTKNNKQTNNLKIKNKKETSSVSPFNIKDKKLFLNEQHKVRSRNKKKKDSYSVMSFDSKYNKNEKNKNNEKTGKEKNKTIKVLSLDDLYKRQELLPGDFVPFKTKSELVYKHVNIITSDDSFDKPEKINIYPSIKFNEIKYTKNLRYKKLGDNPKYVYVDYSKNHTKIHKSRLFDSLSKS